MVLISYFILKNGVTQKILARETLLFYLFFKRISLTALEEWNQNGETKV